MQTRGPAVAVIEDETLPELIELAREGRRDAFDRLIRNFEDQVLRTAVYLVRNFDDAQDVAQEVYIKIFNGVTEIQDPRKVRTWVYRITVNAARDHLRRRRFWEPLTKFRGAGKPSDLLQESEIENRLAVCLARLGFKEKACFILKELQEFETEEIAEILGCRAVTVRGYVHSARKKLSRYFADLGEGP